MIFSVSFGVTVAGCYAWNAYQYRQRILGLQKSIIEHNATTIQKRQNTIDANLKTQNDFRDGHRLRFWQTEYSMENIQQERAHLTTNVNQANVTLRLETGRRRINTNRIDTLETQSEVIDDIKKGKKRTNDAIKKNTEEGTLLIQEGDEATMKLLRTIFKIIKQYVGM